MDRDHADGVFGFQQMTNLDLLAPRKALLVAGANAHSRYYSEDVRTKAPEAVDLYDRMELIPFDRLDEFFGTNLA